MRKWGLWGHQWAQIGATLCALTAVVISTRHIRRHLRHGSDPYVVHVLFMVPVYSVEALLGLLVHQVAPLLEIARSVYEAFVIYAFLQLLVRRLDPNVPIHAVEHVGPFRCILQDWGDEVFIRNALRGTLQYSLLMAPIMLATLCCWAGNVYEQPSQFSPHAAYPYLAVVRNASQLWAMYCLVLFYRATRHVLANFRPLCKFVCIKAIVFFTFWQGLLINYLGHLGYLSPERLERGDEKVTWNQHDIGLGCQNFVITVEMVIFAIAHCYAFQIRDFPLMQTLHTNNLRTIWNGMHDVLRTSLPSSVTASESYAEL